MEAAIIAIVALLCVTLCLLMCFMIARHQRKGKKSEMRQLREECVRTGEVLSLLPEELPFTIYHNHFMGSWLQVLDGYPKLNSFDVYRVQLHHIDTVFNGQRQEWCKTYHNALKIYGPGNGPKAIRAAIHAEHKALYRKTGVERFTQGVLRTAQDFKSMIGNGMSSGELIFFTYVLMGNGEWRFSHTGVGALRDNLSKHAVHSDAAESVVYAGEFHYDVSQDVFVIDNSSGTFSPSKDHLPMMAQLLELNLPGMKVKGLDWQSPELQAAIEMSPTRRKSKEGSKKSKKEAGVSNPLGATPLQGSAGAGGLPVGLLASGDSPAAVNAVGGVKGSDMSIVSFSTVASPVTPLGATFQQLSPGGQQAPAETPGVSLGGTGGRRLPPGMAAPATAPAAAPPASATPPVPPFFLQDPPPAKRASPSDPMLAPLLGSPA